MAARKLLCSVMAVLLSFTAAGCAPSQPAAELPLMIMAEDAVYQHGSGALDASVTIEDSQILGHITTVVNNRVPARNGEANFPAALDAPYTRCPLEEYPDAIVVFFARQWYIFLPLDA